MKAGIHLMLLSSSVISGCAGVAGLMGAHVNAYPGKERPVTEVAVLLNPGFAMLAKVDGKHVGDNTFGYPSDVRVLPGVRKIGLDCMRAGDMTDLGTEDPRKKK